MSRWINDSRSYRQRGEVIHDCPELKKTFIRTLPDVMQMEQTHKIELHAVENFAGQVGQREDTPQVGLDEDE